MEEKKTNESEIQEKTGQIREEIKRAVNGGQGGLVFGVLFTVLAIGVYKKIGEFPIGKMFGIIFGIVAFICFMVSVSCFFDWKKAKKIENMEEENLKEEKEFWGIDISKKDLRAERLYRLNQKELMRYYDMNLTQTKFLSKLGIMLIISGILIIFLSLIWHVFLNADSVLLLTGSICGIFIDFVGAVFIKMYTKNIEAAVQFHAKFAESNNLLLANSIAHKIENDNLREQTLSDVAKKIVDYGKKDN